MNLCSIPQFYFISSSIVLFYFNLLFVFVFCSCCSVCFIGGNLLYLWKLTLIEWKDLTSHGQWGASLTMCHRNGIWMEIIQNFTPKMTIIGWLIRKGDRTQHFTTNTTIKQYWWQQQQLPVIVRRGRRRRQQQYATAITTAMEVNLLSFANGKNLSYYPWWSCEGQLLLFLNTAKRYTGNPIS